MADIKCINEPCPVKGTVENPDGMEITDLTRIDHEPDLKAKGQDYLIWVCPACATSAVAILKEKAPEEARYRQTGHKAAKKKEEPEA